MSGRVLGAVVRSLALGVAGCGPSPAGKPSSASMSKPADDTVVFGTMRPLSGPLSAQGTAQTVAMEHAVDEASAAGGLLGKRLVLRADNGGCDPSRSGATRFD